MSKNDLHSRRTFLGLGVVGAGFIALDPLATASRLFAASPDAVAPGEAERILVIVQLSGGNDGLNTVIPFADPEYGRARNRLRIQRKDILTINASQGLHPSLKGFLELYKAGQLAIVQGVGYPNPNRSHFKSMDIWHSADPTGRDHRYGWLGRTLDLLAGKAGNNDPDLAINVSQRVPLALNGSAYKPVSFQVPALYRFQGTRDQGEAFAKMSRESNKSDSPILSALRKTAKDALESSNEIRRTATSYRTPVRYPRSQLANSLRTVASLIAGGLSTRVYYTFQGGYDTHVNQAGRHGNLLGQFDAAVTKFLEDLERSGNADRVVVMAFSEFGRRVRENQSSGTDHGVAGPMFLAGKKVRGGLHGTPPSLVDLVRGDLKHNVDFRQVYASLIGGWLGVDASKVLRGQFETLPVLA